MSDATGGPTSPEVARPPRWRRPAIGTALALATAVAAGLAIGLAARRSTPSVAGIMSFEARTFDRLPITNARFMPDGQTIVYSAAPLGYLPPDLFVINADAEAPQPLGISRAHLLSVSSKGELAIITDARRLDQRLYSGTLARMTLGSSPRPIMEDVREADWSPDGASLAIVHDLRNGRDRLEFPVGTRPARSQRIPERSARLAGRIPRGVLRAPVAVRRSRLAEGGRSRRHSHDAGGRALGTSGTCLDA